MHEAPVLLDSLYEYIGFRSAASFQAALNSFSIPLLCVLAGVAWRIFRVAEDGAIRPLVFYVITVFIVWWGCSPSSRDPVVGPHLKAPKFLAALDAASDGVVRRAIEGIDKDFLDGPFEWERLALIGSTSSLQDPGVKLALKMFFQDCAEIAIARVPDPSETARRNPLAEGSGLPYDKILIDENRSCENFRKDLLKAAGREVDTLELHLDIQRAMQRYSAGEKKEIRNLYLDKIIRNAWSAPDPPDPRERSLVQKSVGKFELYDPARTTTNSWVDVVLGVYAVFKQSMSDQVEMRQRQYLITTAAPVIYGCFVMLVMSLFPIAGMYALLPGKATTLLRYAQVLFSIKLWPFGWALMTQFTEWRSVRTALSDVAEGADYVPPGVFVTICLMYVIVPSLCFLAVQLVSKAASIPFQQAMSGPAGGDIVAAANSVASKAVA